MCKRLAGSPWCFADNVRYVKLERTFHIRTLAVFHGEIHVLVCKSLAHSNARRGVLEIVTKTSFARDRCRRFELARWSVLQLVGGRLTEALARGLDRSRNSSSTMFTKPPP